MMVMVMSVLISVGVVLKHDEPRVWAPTNGLAVEIRICLSPKRTFACWESFVSRYSPAVDVEGLDQRAPGEMQCLVQSSPMSTGRGKVCPMFSLRVIPSVDPRRTQHDHLSRLIEWLQR
jgi:hypothetical protein